jgi:hypothetical protein
VTYQYGPPPLPKVQNNSHHLQPQSICVSHGWEKIIENNNAHCRLQKFVSHKEEKTKKQLCTFIPDFNSWFIV